MTELETELEYKFDVPLSNLSTDHVTREVLERLEHWIKECGIKVIWRKQTDRMFRYFDTSDLRNAHQGWTMRHVTGFDPDKGDGQNHHRYDLKLGAVNTDERQEANRWSDHVLSPDEYATMFELTEKLQCTCKTTSTHHKFLVRFNNARIEISLDIIFDQKREKILFVELEFELQDDISHADTLRDMVKDIRQYFPEDLFPQTTEQKYTRLMADRL